MNDPFEKERQEYENAQKSAEEAKKLIGLALEPLGIETPLAINPDAMRDLLEKEEIKHQKYQALMDCQERNKN